MNPPRGRLVLMIVSGLVALACIVPAQALAAPVTKVVSYHGYRLVVPAAWPVYHLQTDRTQCVRFDRHAVYLGQPGSEQRCPSTPAGRTEAILVQQLHGSAGDTAAQPLPIPAPGTTAGGGTAAQIVNHAHRVIVTATWDRHPAVIRRALSVRSLAAAARRSATRPQPSTVARAGALVHSDARARTSAVSLPGQVYTGLGFDACSTPSTSHMAAWGSSPYRAIGVYIGGTNMACSQPNLNPAWVSQQSAAGWHLIPIYVGLQPPGSCGCSAISTSPTTAAGEGVAAANDAIADAQAIGLGTGNPLYLDVEAYTRTSTHTAAVLAFVQGWTEQLHAGGYRSGVYVNDDSGVPDLVNNYGTGFTEPDVIWFANWNNAETTSDPAVPPSYWASHQRLHQYSGGHNARYGGVTINIDGNYVDASTAAAGADGTFNTPTPALAPSLRVSPAANGTINLLPRWLHATGVTAWQLLGGQSPSGLAPLGPPVGTGTRLPVVSQNAYRYYAVTALGSGGQALGTSSVVTTPAHLAIFGQSVFIPRQGFGGIPVGCFSTSDCTHVTATITLGGRTLLKTGGQRIPAGGGLAYFSLTVAQRAQLWSAHRHQELVTIALHSPARLTGASRQITLTSFWTGGGPLPRSLGQSAALRLVGTADFISNGWVGGILADCVSAAPCQSTMTIVAQGQVIAQTHAQTLGVGQLGYLLFTLTPAGHQLLAGSPGNQLPATVTVTTGRATAVGHLVLSAYN